MNILIDTHALHWYISDLHKLTKNVETILDNSEQIFIPTIVLLELLYLLEKQKQENRFSLVLNQIKKDKRFIIMAFDMAVLNIFIKIKDKFEMHDKIIVATAKMLNLPLITKDPEIQKVYKNTIW